MARKSINRDQANRQFRSPQEKKKGRKTLIIVLLLTILVPVYFYLKNQTSSFISPLDQAQEYKIVNENPISTIFFDPGKKLSPAKSIDDLKQIFEALINSLQGSYGIYFIDLINGAEVSISADRIFDAASVVKIVPMALYYQLVEKGEFILDEEYILEKDHIQDYGTGSMKNQEAGTKYTYADLLELSGKESDNTADWVIRRKVGEKNINEFIQNNNMINTDPGKVLSAPREIGSFFLNLEHDKILGKKYKNLLYDNLTDTEFEERIPAGIPENIRVVHKTGNGFHRSYSDCGIVFGPKPFVLCVMSQDASYEEAMTLIPMITKAAYEWSVLGR